MELDSFQKACNRYSINHAVISGDGKRANQFALEFSVFDRKLLADRSNGKRRSADRRNNRSELFDFKHSKIGNCQKWLGAKPAHHCIARRVVSINASQASPQGSAKGIKSMAGSCATTSATSAASCCW